PPPPPPPPSPYTSLFRSTHPAGAVSDHDEGGEREAPAALDHLGHPVERDDLLLELSAAVVAAIHAHGHDQNLNPASRAASASARDRKITRLNSSHRTISY